MTEIRIAWEATAQTQAQIRALGPLPSASAVGALEDSLTNGLTNTSAAIDRAQVANAADVRAVTTRRNTIDQVAPVAVLIALVLGAAFGLWRVRRLGRSILTPVSALVDASERMVTGETTEHIAVAGPAELEGLARSFNSMADTVLRREQRLLALVENASDGIMVMDVDGRVIFATPRLEAAVIGDIKTSVGIGDLVHPDDRPRLGKAWQRVLAEELGAGTEIEARLRAKDGTWRYVSARFTNRMADPAVAGMILNVADVTERHDYDEKLTPSGVTSRSHRR